MLPVIISAIVALLVSVIGAAVTFKTEENRLRTKFRTEFMAEEAIRRLLSVDHWQLRSFEKIKKRLGGFPEEELRRLLVRAGALRFEDRQGKELWGLRDKNLDRLRSD